MISNGFQNHTIITTKGRMLIFCHPLKTELTPNESDLNPIKSLKTDLNRIKSLKSYLNQIGIGPDLPLIVLYPSLLEGKNYLLLFIIVVLKMALV